MIIGLLPARSPLQERIEFDVGATAFLSDDDAAVTPTPTQTVLEKVQDSVEEAVTPDATDVVNAAENAVLQNGTDPMWLFLSAVSLSIHLHRCSSGFSIACSMLMRLQ